MATPTAICPICFVRFPVTEATSTPTSCPACAHKFAAPVQNDDEPAQPKRRPKAITADKPLKPTPAKPVQAAPVARRISEDAAKPKPSKASRTGFRRRGDEDDETDTPATKSSWMLIGLLGGGFALLGLLVVLVMVSQSQPADQSAELAKLVSPTDTNVASLPFNPEPFQPVPNPQPLPNPNPVRPPIGPPVQPFDPNPFPQPQFPKFPNMPPVRPVRPALPPEPPKAKFELPAVVPVVMKPAPLTEDSTEVKLPGAVTDACVGGGGRYYCLLIGGKKLVAVFDVCEAKVVKYLPVAESGAKIAANMNKLLVVYPDTNLVARYDLTTGTKEATVKLPFDGKVKVVAMGSASAGPLLVQYQAGNGALDRAPVAYLDPIKMTAFDLSAVAGGMGGSASVRDAMHYRASPDGTVFGVWCTSHSPSGLGALVLTDGAMKNRYEHDSVGHIVPGPDGTLHTLMGRYTSTLKKKGEKNRGFALPAAGGNLYFTLAAEGAGNAPRFPVRGGPEVKQQADIKMDGDDRSLVTLKDLPGSPTDAWTSGDFTADKRYLLVPDAKAFVALASTNDKLVLRKFDMIASMEAAGVDYLFVTSRPQGFRPGANFEYQIDAKSKKGGVTYALESGPDGLKVSPAGRVTWAVPKGYAGGDSVIITVADQSGQQVFHTFALKEAPAGAVAVAPLPPEPAAPPMPPVVKPPVAVAPGPKDNPDEIVKVPARPFDQPSSTLTEKTVVSLPDAADAMGLGGGGRFILYRLPKTKQLAVLDLCLGKVVKYLPLAEAGALFAAGMNKVFIYSPTADVFQRYDLLTFTKEVTVKNPVASAPKILLMGHSTDGPLAGIGGGGRFPGEGGGLTFLNTQTFKTEEVKNERGGGIGHGGFDSGAVVRVSGDGRVYGWHRTQVSPQGFNSISLSGRTAKSYNDHTTPWFVGVGSDGTLFAGTGLYTSEHKPIGGKSVRGSYPNPVNVPATAAPWYVRVTYGDQWVAGGAGREKTKNEVALALVSDSTVALPLANHDGFEFPKDTPHPAHVGNGIPFHDLDRFVLNPRAGVLAIIDGTGSKVHLHPINLKAMLAKSGKDYLMVMSQPAAARKGQKWTYTPEVWSKSGKAVVKIETGPPGMTASGGTVTWDVPGDYAEADTQVILTVSDGGKQETFHTFTLPITATK